MKISVDFELEYDVTHADQATFFAKQLGLLARELEQYLQEVKLAKETVRQVMEEA